MNVLSCKSKCKVQNKNKVSFIKNKSNNYGVVCF